ncbi:hypothetical protein [Polyangium aurulentum]|uniref:hypothetical protein n=1 Tax=Polyangium aurulentum TaxID=2567896 RepID=UPI0010ADADE3|nr:hypothetical protein [Polyangium aurulentum]UQA54982.1 hypothetical protein E8A73_026890 [Polyangium aurulentum]
MRNLILADLKLALRELLGARNADLLLSGTGKVYAPQLAHKLTEIEALPEALTGGRPFAQELAEADDTHDGHGEAIYYQIEALLRLPFTEAEQKASLQRIRDAFVPRLGVLRDAYADEAAAAAKNRPALAALKDELMSVSVPVPQGATLYDWASAFVDAGDKMGKLLSDRSLAGSGAVGAQALQLRSATIGLLSRFRSALADEITHDANLPRNLDARVFSYFDELQGMREQAAKAAKGGKGGEEGKGAAKE